MDSDSWTSRLSAASRRFHSRSDLYHGGEDFDGDDESRPEFLCPFCAEDFDVVGLCCHIEEEHAVEAKSGVCPVCAKRVGMDLVPHITTQHGSLLKVQRKKRFRKHGSHLTFALLRKELREGNLQALLGGSHYPVSSSSEADPLLSSFIYNLPEISETVRETCHSPAQASSVKQSTAENSSERTMQPPALSDKDQEERARRCEFVQGLLLSTFLDDNL
ncbi:hypothetical protein NMG60_11032929 [Bertholletia excelsa]